MSELVITNYKNSTICAVYEQKNMVEVAVFGKKEVLLGNIYVGRVDNIVKNINAAFVNISPQESCYLDLSAVQNAVFVKKQSEKKISIGDELLVQVIKEDVKTKAPVVSTSFSLTGKYVVLMHQAEGIQISKKIHGKAVRARLKELVEPFASHEFGMVVRTNAQEADAQEIQKEAEQLKKQYEKLLSFGIHQTKYSLLYHELPAYLKQIRDMKSGTMEKIVTNLPQVYEEITEYLKENPQKDAEGKNLPVQLIQDANELVILYKINHFMDRALHKTLYLKSGATIVIEPTEALTVVDVNTGKAIAGKKATEETFFQINAEAAKEIATQIRLRNISGIIIIDFINMEEKENETKLKEILKELLSGDPVQTELVEITKLGLMELTRKKICKTLAEQLADAQ